MSLSHRIDKDSFVGHLRRILHVEPARLKGTPTRRKGEVDQVRAKYHAPRYPRKKKAESEQKQLNEAITDGQQPVTDEAGDLVPGGVPPAGVVSAPGPTRDSRGKFAAGGTSRAPPGARAPRGVAADEEPTVSPAGGMLANCLHFTFFASHPAG